MSASAIALGTFDGVHLGHQYLINQLIKVAKTNKLESTVLTLAAPVRFVPGVLSTIDEKVQLIREFPVDNILILPITSDIINQPAEMFFDNFLHKKLNVKYIVVGENFAFGQNRRGDINWLRKIAVTRKVKVKIIKPIKYRNQIISSSSIRTHISNTKLLQANQLLGRFYTIEGIPVKGRGIGKKIGYPTINLKVENNKLLPEGVFIVWVKNNDVFLPGVMNIGTKPTFFKKGKTSVEINLLNFHGFWTKTKTTVYLCERIRSEKIFKSLSDLKNQISQDIEKAKKYFRVP